MRSQIIFHFFPHNLHEKNKFTKFYFLSKNYEDIIQILYEKTFPNHDVFQFY
jgi:hypothetical protein